MAAPSDVVVSDRLSDANQVRFRGTTGLNVSWSLSRAGGMTFEVPYYDLARYGFVNPLDLRGKWIRYEHPTAGKWGGVVMNVAPSNRVVVIGAESWEIALQGVATRGGGGPKFGLITMLMQQVDQVSSLTGIRRGTMDLGGQGEVWVLDSPVASGVDLYDTFIPSVLDRWVADRIKTPRLQAAGWGVDPETRRLSFDSTYGVDRSASVSLMAGRHVVGTDLSADLGNVVNTVFITGKVNYTWTEGGGRGGKGKRRTKRVTRTGVKMESVIGVNVASRNRFGEKAVVFRQDFPSSSKMQAEANSRARSLTLDTINASVQTADVNGLWALIREGDIIHARLAGDGVSGKMVVRERHLDVGAGIMTYAGELLPT